MRNTELCVRRRNVFRGCVFFFAGDFNHRSFHTSPKSLLRRTFTSLAVQVRSRYSTVSSGATVRLAIIAPWPSWKGPSLRKSSRGCQPVSTAATLVLHERLYTSRHKPNWKGCHNLRWARQMRQSAILNYSLQESLFDLPTYTADVQQGHRRHCRSVAQGSLTQMRPVRRSSGGMIFRSNGTVRFFGRWRSVPKWPQSSTYRRPRLSIPSRSL